MQLHPVNTPVSRRSLSDREQASNGRHPGTKEGRSNGARPILEERGVEVQRFGQLVPLPNGLKHAACEQSIKALNQVLADTMTLRDLYKKHHWQIAGPTFYQLHLLFDKHFREQAELVDAIAERIQLLGGIGVAMGADVAEITRIERPPMGRESVPVQITRLLEAHEEILKQAREGAKRAEDAGDSGTNDLLVSDVVRTSELQVWFLAEHLVDLPMVADEDDWDASGNQHRERIGAD